MSGYVGSKRSSSLVSATEITLDGAKLKSSGDSITKSDGTTAVLSESSGTVTFTTNNAIIEGSSSGDLVRITQTGSGNALVVEDSSNPDSTPFVVTSDGSVGINVSPDSNSKLHILDDTSSLDDYTIQIESYTPAIVLHDISGASTDFAIQVDGSALMFRYGDASTKEQLASEAMRIDSSGSSRFFANNPIIAATSAGANTTTANAIFIGRHSATSTTNGTNCIFITSNGNIINTTGVYGQISDEKLKENIIDATNKLPDVLNLRVRNFNLKQGQTHKQIGFIAQEFEQVFPHLVDTLPDVDADGNETGEFTKSIKTSVLMPILVKAIQEQQTIIESQQSQIDALTTKTQEQDLTIASLISRIEALETQP